MPRKPSIAGQGGNAAWRALSSVEPKGPPPKVTLRLTPLDVYARRDIDATDLRFRGGAGRHGKAK